MGSVIRALWGPGWTRLPFANPRKVLPQRGHGLRPPIKVSACQGVQDGDDGPFPRSPETAAMQGKVRGGSVIHVLWGPGWTRLPGSADARSTATTGHALAATTTAELSGGCRPEGSAIAIVAPVTVPRKLPICRGKCLGVRDPRPLGAGMDSSGFAVGGVPPSGSAPGGAAPDCRGWT